MQLAGKTVLVTGANRGIGRALAEELANYPVNLLLGMRDPKAFKPITNAKANSITLIELDLSSLVKINDGLKKASAELENLDILVNNAGQYLAGPIDKQDPEKLALMVQVNLTGLMQLTAALLPTLTKRHGKIVNNASIVGYTYLPFNATYSATKAGVVAFSESLRRELKGKVGVLHLVTPGVQTEMMDDVNATYTKAGHPISLKTVPAQVWARKVVKAIQTDKTMLTPGGTTEIGRLLSRGPRFLMDIVAKRLV